MTARDWEAKASLSSMTEMSVEGEAGELEDFGDGEDGADAHLFREAAGDRVGDEAAEGLEVELGGAAGVHENGDGGAVGGLRGVASGDSALGTEGGFEFGEGFEGGVSAGTFVGREEGFIYVEFAATLPGVARVMGMGMSSESNLPAAWAARAFWWDAKGRRPDLRGRFCSGWRRARR